MIEPGQKYQDVNNLSEIKILEFGRNKSLVRYKASPNRAIQFITKWELELAIKNNQYKLL